MAEVLLDGTVTIIVSFSLFLALTVVTTGHKCEMIFSPFYKYFIDVNASFRFHNIMVEWHGEIVMIYQISL